MNQKKTANQLVAELAQRFAETLDAALPPGELALVDFPDYSNVGDSAIWLGEMAYLRERGRLPAYYSATADFDDEACIRAIGDGPILIQGGGNMGTLWPKHEAFRLHLLRKHRGRPVVQMPQSLHYGDPAAVSEMAAAIRAHGQFTLLVRDTRSLAFAREHFDCSIHLCPDAALMLGRQQRAPARVPVFALLRTDHERAADDAELLPEGVAADDWIDENPSEKRFLRLSLKLGRLLAGDPMAARAVRQRRLAEWRLQRGLAMLSRGEVVVTDRLHAHILALLLDIPHVLLDNSYGKVAGFADQWTSEYGGLMRAANRADAFVQAFAWYRADNAPRIING